MSADNAEEVEPQEGRAKKVRKKTGTRKPGRSRKRAKPEDLIQEESPLEFFNRDIEWLEFNVRVLNEALDTRTPLLERVRFLSICNSNLDEFFMKRVFALKHRVASGVMKQSGGLTPLQQLAAIRAKIQPMLKDEAVCYQTVLKPELAKNGIHVLDWRDLTEKEKNFATHYFKANIFPVLTPLAVDPGLPFSERRRDEKTGNQGPFKGGADSSMPALTDRHQRSGGGRKGRRGKNSNFAIVEVALGEVRKDE